MKFKKPLDLFKMTPWAREITETVEQMGPLRLMKGLLIALQYHHKAAEGRLERKPGA